MILRVIILDKVNKRFGSIITGKAKKIAKFLKKTGVIEVYLIGGKRMKRLNNQFRHKNKSTNILSFVKPKGFPGRELGEVYLDPIYIDKNKESLDLMLVHGVLHILGYDHKQKRGRIIMQKKEKQLLLRIKSKKLRS